MNADQEKHYTTDYVVTDDGAVAFRCSADREEWPWLALHPANNIVIQTANYYSLTGVSGALGRLDPEKWTALTSFQWRVYADALHATHGIADPRPGDEKLDYAASFFNKDGALVYRVGGTGVVFRNRDFKAWREKAKTEILALPEPASFSFTTPEAVGVATEAECFIGNLSDGEAVFVDALVTDETGFEPGHPYHDGSGDHVNSTHICDAAQQAARLIRGENGGKAYPNAGKVAFNRYIELNRPFRILLLSDPSALTELTFAMEQGGHSCAQLTFFYDD